MLYACGGGSRSNYRVDWASMDLCSPEYDPDVVDNELPYCLALDAVRTGDYIGAGEYAILALNLWKANNCEPSHSWRWIASIGHMTANAAITFSSPDSDSLRQGLGPKWEEQTAELLDAAILTLVSAIKSGGSRDEILAGLEPVIIETVESNL